MKKVKPNTGKLQLSKQQVLRLEQRDQEALKGGSLSPDTAIASGASRCCQIHSAGCSIILPSNNCHSAG